MDLSNFEIGVIIIGVIIGLIVVGLIILFISGLIKEEFDKEDKEGDSGVVGWIIAIIIAIIIIWAICKPDNREPQYRHSYNSTPNTTIIAA